MQVHRDPSNRRPHTVEDLFLPSLVLSRKSLKSTIAGATWSSSICDDAYLSRCWLICILFCSLNKILSITHLALAKNPPSWRTLKSWPPCQVLGRQNQHSPPAVAPTGAGDVPLIVSRIEPCICCPLVGVPCDETTDGVLP